ncbi:MAG TPA: hypothetical protein VGG28_05170 [Kofleriaceae bacterium]
MKQIVGVVFAFIALNSVGFVVYRASSTSAAATTDAPRSNIAPDPIASQPKPTVGVDATITQNPNVSAPTSTTSVEESAAPSPTSNLVENSHSASRPRAPVKTPPPRRVQQSAAPAPKPTVEPTASSPTTTPAQPVTPPPAAKPDDVIHQMEANPYKRGE